MPSRNPSAKPSRRTQAERTAARRAELIEQGYRQKSYVLSPRALRALDKLAAIHGSAVQALEAILPEAAAALRR